MTRFVKFGTKVGLVGGTVYYTTELGLWKDSTKSEEVYKDIYSLVVPYVKEIPVEVPEIPRMEDVTAATTSYWNHGVVAVTEFLSDLPTHTYSLSQKAANFANSTFESLTSEAK